MKCPHCSKDIKDELVLQAAAAINGRRSKRKLTSEQASAMGRKRWAKKEDTDAKD